MSRNDRLQKTVWNGVLLALSDIAGWRCNSRKSDAHAAVVLEQLSGAREGFAFFLELFGQIILILSQRAFTSPHSRPT